MKLNEGEAHETDVKRQDHKNKKENKTKMKAPKQVSVVLFYNKKGEVLLQDRREISKWGEQYGFFGGTVEEGETPEQTIRRELQEELELTEVTLEFFRRYTHTNPELGVEVDRSVYLAKMPSLENLACNEGKPELRTFEDSFGLKMIPGFNELLQEIHQSLKEKNEIK